jgi:tRNA pseudouridine55 synthase
MSSRQAVDRVIELAGGVKCGHTGTLDPQATGVLVICIGRATRLIRYAQQMVKHYRAGIRFGWRSDTHDLEGQLEQVPDAEPLPRQAVEECLQSFLGEQEQVPPRHSAVHVAGKRAYELARAGREFQLPPRTVHIYQLECLKYDWPEATLSVACSAGTYVRALVRDLGERLGCGAVMSSLLRTAVGPFRLDEAVTLERLEAEGIDRHLLPARLAVLGMPVVSLPARRLRRLASGTMVDVPSGIGKLARRELRQPAVAAAADFGGRVAVCDEQGRLVAVAAVADAGRTLKPETVIADPRSL